MKQFSIHSTIHTVIPNKQFDRTKITSRRDNFRNYNNSGDNYNRYNQRRVDHGENFAPGHEDAPNQAPQSLDHFKRGFQTRSNQRENHFHNYDYKGSGGPPINSNGGGGNNSYGGGGRGNGGGRGYGNRGDGGGDDFPRQRRGSSGSFGGGRGRGGRGRGGGRESSFRDGFRGGRGDRRPYGDRDDRRGGQQIIMGLDIQALVDRLVRPGCDVFRELGITRESHMAVFQSGKAVTAIISNLARRRNLRIANAVWDWIDYIGIEKNTFHYNSMISACEKVRDYKKALRLLDEMKAKKVAKNEVT